MEGKDGREEREERRNGRNGREKGEGKLRTPRSFQKSAPVSLNVCRRLVSGQCELEWFQEVTTDMSERSPGTSCERAKETRLTCALTCRVRARKIYVDFSNLV